LAHKFHRIIGQNVTLWFDKPPPNVTLSTPSGVFHLDIFSGMSALMYANSLSSLVPTPYNPYVWHHIPGLFLPYSNKMESLSPESAASADHAFTPENVKIGEFGNGCRFRRLNNSISFINN
jgi:hypothetical protein